MSVKKVFFGVVVGALLFVGCSVQQRAGGAVKPICLAGLERSAAIEAVEEVLGRLHFTVAKADYESGVIVTRPLPGAEFFEFWRSDSAGRFNKAEASLHTIRRTVEVSMEERGGQLCIGSDVKVERLNLPSEEITSFSQMPYAFAAGSGSRQNLELSDEQMAEASWVDLGSDNELAEVIIRRIEKELASGQ